MRRYTRHYLLYTVRMARNYLLFNRATRIQAKSGECGQRKERPYILQSDLQFHGSFHGFLFILMDCRWRILRFTPFSRYAGAIYHFKRKTRETMKFLLKFLLKREHCSRVTFGAVPWPLEYCGLRFVADFVSFAALVHVI